MSTVFSAGGTEEKPSGHHPFLFFAACIITLEHLGQTHFLFLWKLLFCSTIGYLHLGQIISPNGFMPFY